MKCPLIGITVSFSEEKSHTLYYNYSTLIKKAGGEAVLLPYDFAAYSVLDGVIFSGGGDVDGALGGYENSSVMSGVLPERDTYEMKLFEAAFARQLPMLGICRGHQLVNVALGGTLHRDIKEAGFSEEHQIGAVGTHEMRTEEGSLARELFGETAAVWSTHHQAVREPGRGFRVTARSPEGVIEVIEHENGRILGLQTHPERMNFHPPFAWLVNACGK